MSTPHHFRIEPLNARHIREAFCCGEDSLDRYLKHQAGQDMRRGAATPFVLIEPGSLVVKGYYTLSMTGIQLESLPDEMIKRLPRYPVVPAILLGRLAVDKSCRGQGIGLYLLANALKRSLRSEIAWAGVVVDALDDQARGFYEHFGFSRLPGYPHKMFMMKSVIEAALRMLEQHS